MKPQLLGLWVASAVFATLAFAQLMRLAFRPEVTINGHDLPLWPSAIAAGVLAMLSVWIWSLTRREARR